MSDLKYTCLLSNTWTYNVNLLFRGVKKDFEEEIILIKNLIVGNDCIVPKSKKRAAFATPRFEI